MGPDIGAMRHESVNFAGAKILVSAGAPGAAEFVTKTNSLVTGQLLQDQPGVPKSYRSRSCFLLCSSFAGTRSGEGAAAGLTGVPTVDGGAVGG